MDLNILSRILSGEANPEERNEFYNKLGDNSEDKELFYEMKSLWIRSSIQNKSLDVETAYNEFRGRIRKPVREGAYSFGVRMLKYAAILCLMLCIGAISGYYYSVWNIEKAESGTQKFTALKGSVSIIELADGTKIWLNSGSQLSYREDIKGNQRLAELTGEAYFEVAHHDRFPFLVKAGKMTIRDLGTTFNIKAYSGDNTIETSLVEGKAELLNSTGHSFLTLKPGESAIYSKDNERIAMKPVSESVLSAWRDGKFVIRDQRLEDIFIELSRWYDVKFKFEDQKLKDYRFTGNIKKSTTAQHILKMLKVTTNFNYRIIENSAESDVIIIY